MKLSSHSLRSALLACAAVVLPLAAANAAEPIRIVFQNGRAVAISSVTLQGTNLSVTVAADGFAQGQTFPLDSADHVYGDKPAEINQGIALLLSGKPGDALKVLEPVVASQRITAKIPGNFWLEAARAALIAYAQDANPTKAADLGKEIADATPQQGIDPFSQLSKALTMLPSAKFEDKETALKDLTADNLPADVCAFASYYRGNLLKTAKKDKEALEAYLSVPCLYPTGGMLVNAVAELKSSEYLAALNRREEAVALLNSCISHSTGTMVAAEANKRLESLK